MPNWCSGILKVRGEKRKIVRFLKESLQMIPNYSKYDFDEEQDLYVGGPFYLNPTKRGFIDNIEANFDLFEQDEEMVIRLNYRQAWNVETEELLLLCQKYNIDMKIYATEPCMCFDLDILIENGEIIKDNTLKFSDYVFDSPI